MLMRRQVAQLGNLALFPLGIRHTDGRSELEGWRETSGRVVIHQDTTPMQRQDTLYGTITITKPTANRVFPFPSLQTALLLAARKAHFEAMDTGFSWRALVLCTKNAGSWENDGSIKPGLSLLGMIMILD